MFNLRDFILKGIKGMVGNEPDYRVIEYSVGWYDKEVLTEADLAEIDVLIDEKNTVTEVIEDDEVTGE